MKRASMRSLSRLTLRLPVPAIPSGWGQWLKSRLLLEELEGREVPAPLVFDPSFSGGYAIVAENGSTASSLLFSGCTTFSVVDFAGTTFPPYTADLTVGDGVTGNGTLTVDVGTAFDDFGVVVTGNNTGHLTFVGGVNSINSFLQNSGFVFTPTSYYSGTEKLNLTITDSSANSDSGQITVFVSPVADPPDLSTYDLTGTFSNLYNAGTESEYYVQTVFGLPVNASYSGSDLDGSEGFSYIDVQVPENTHPDPGTTGSVMVWDPTPYGNDVQVINSSLVRFYEAAIADFRFNSQKPLQPSALVFTVHAVSTDSAIDPNGNTVVATAETTGEFTITYLPGVQLDSLPDEVYENQNDDGTGGFVVDPILDDPTSASSDGYTLSLTGTNGVFQTVEWPYGNLVISGSGTATLTISGSTFFIQQYLDSESVTFVPTQYFSGTVQITADLTGPPDPPPPPPPTSFAGGGEPFQTFGVEENGERTGSYTYYVKVLPVLSDTTLYIGYESVYTTPTGPTALSNNFNYLTPWADEADNSEYALYSYRITGVADPSQFQLMTSSGAPLTYDAGNNTWSTGQNFYDWEAFRSSLNSLVIIPPEGYLGTATLNVEVLLRDFASYSHLPDYYAFDNRTLSGCVTLQWVEPATVTLPTVTGQEGGTLDLGGEKYVASDPQGYYYQPYSLTLSVPYGFLTADTSGLGESSLEVYQNGPGSITLVGYLDSINYFLSQPGSITYKAADAHFGGVVPLTVTLDYEYGEGCVTSFTTFEGENDSYQPLFTGTSFLILNPVADAVPPVVQDAATPQDTPVGLSITLPPLNGGDPSQTVTILVSGLPPGATLNRGTNLGGGVWQLTPNDLAGLIFTPPVGQSGSYLLTIQVIATDPGDPLPNDEPNPSSFAADSALPVAPPSIVTSIAFLTITVQASPVAPPDDTGPQPQPVSPPVNLPPATTETTAFGAITDSTTTTTGVSVSTETTTPTTTSTGAEISTSTAAAFGMIPGSELENARLLDLLSKEMSLPALGSMSSGTTAASSSFAAGREKHPLQPIQALEHESATTLFEGSGDSIQLIDQLYRDSASPPRNDTAPASTGEPSTSAIPTDRIKPAAADRFAGESRTAAGEGMSEVDEISAAHSRSDSNDDRDERSGWQSSAAVGILPLLGVLLMTDGRRRTPTIRRWLQNAMFQPRPART